MAKKSRTRRRSYFVKRAVSRAKKMTFPIAVIAGLAPGVATTVTATQQGGFMVGARMLGLSYTGYDMTTGKFSAASLKAGLLPLVVGTAIHKLAGMLGINRAIAGAGIPFLRI